MYLFSFLLSFYMIKSSNESNTQIGLLEKRNSIFELTEDEKKNFNFFRKSNKEQHEEFDKLKTKIPNLDTARKIIQFVGKESVTNLNYEEVDFLLFSALFLKLVGVNDFFKAVVGSLNFNVEAYNYICSLYHRYNSSSDENEYIIHIFYHFITRISHILNLKHYSSRKMVCIINPNETGTVKFENSEKTKIIVLSFEFFHNLFDSYSKATGNSLCRSKIEEAIYLPLMTLKCLFGRLFTSKNKFLPANCKIIGKESKPVNISQLVVSIFNLFLYDGFKKQIKSLYFKNCCLEIHSLKIFSFFTDIKFVSIELCFLENMFWKNLWNKSKEPLNLNYLTIRNCKGIDNNIILLKSKRMLNSITLNNNIGINTTFFSYFDILSNSTKSLRHMSIDVCNHSIINQIFSIAMFKSLVALEFCVSLPNKAHITRFLKCINSLFLELELKRVSIIIYAGIVKVSDLKFNWKSLNYLILRGVIIDGGFAQKGVKYQLILSNVYFNGFVEFGGIPIVHQMDPMFFIDESILDFIIRKNNVENSLIFFNLNFNFVKNQDYIKPYKFVLAKQIYIYNYSDKYFELAEKIFTSVEMPKLVNLILRNSSNLGRILRLININKINHIEINGCEDFSFRDLINDECDIPNLKIVKIKLVRKTPLGDEEIDILKKIKTLVEFIAKGNIYCQKFWDVDSKDLEKIKFIKKTKNTLA